MVWIPDGEVVREFWSKATEIIVGGLISPRKYTVTAINAETQEELIYKVDVLILREMKEIMCSKPFPAQIRFRIGGVPGESNLHLIVVYKGTRLTTIEIKPDY